MNSSTLTEPPTGAVRVRPARVPQRLRNLELVLLLLALAISGFAIWLAEAGTGVRDPGLLPQLVWIPAALLLALHVVLRIVAREADPFILPIGALLTGIGITMIHRLDIAERTLDWSGFAVRQVVWASIGIAAAIAVVLVLRNHRLLQRYTYLAMLGAIVLLILPSIPGIGTDRNTGSYLWIDLGIATFQPGEIAKILLAVFFAGYLVQRRDALSAVGRTVLGIRFPRVRDLGPILVVWAASMLVLILQRDLGTSLLYFGLFLVMLYVATGRTSWVIIGLLLFAGGAVLASRLLPYVAGRFNAWINAFDPAVYDAVGGSYQLVQGLFGMAHGELLGAGLGRGYPYIVPLAESDFIIPSLGEELGLIGLFAILALFLLLVSRGLRIGFAGQDDFGTLLAVGLSFVIALQCFIVIGGVTLVIPVTGLTTPFLSAGGSSLVANWMIAAILLRISDSVRNQRRMVV